MDELIPIVAIIAVFGIPIIAILTHHQRKMAELIHRGHSSEISPMAVDEINRLNAEVQQLRTDLHEAVIALDDASRLKLGPEGKIEERMRD